MPTKANTVKKRVFIEKMKKTLGNVTASSEAAKINRCTYYEWLEKDPAFKAAIDAIEESCIDFAESALKKQIEDGNPTSTIFYLKTKGKKRGYIETTEVAGKLDIKRRYDDMTEDELKAEAKRLQNSINNL